MAENDFPMGMYRKMLNPVPWYLQRTENAIAPSAPSMPADPNARPGLGKIMFDIWEHNAINRWSNGLQRLVGGVAQNIAAAQGHNDPGIYARTPEEAAARAANFKPAFSSTPEEEITALRKWREMNMPRTPAPEVPFLGPVARIASRALPVANAAMMGYGAGTAAYNAM